MLRTITLAGLATLALVVTAPANAVPISGDLDMSGRFSTDTGNLADASTLFVEGAIATGGAGDYASVPVGTVINHASFTFGPTLAGPVDPLWWLSVGSVSYWFTMNDVEVLAQSTTELVLRGAGTLYITGFDPTPGIWEFSGWSQNGRFKFVSESASVPEPGTLALLGHGILGVGFARRRKTN
jgi:hypothetical protein